MRHRKSGRQLGRNSAHRKAMYRNMATSLLEHGRIRTTDAKAKELRRVVERLITLSKRVLPSAIDAAAGDAQRELRAQRVHAVRQARKWVKSRVVLQKLFSEYSERYQDRPGGYTRITKIGRRPGDNAPMSLIELVDGELVGVASASAPAVETGASVAAAAAFEDGGVAGAPEENGEGGEADDFFADTDEGSEQGS